VLVEKSTGKLEGLAMEKIKSVEGLGVFKTNGQEI